MLCNAVLVPHFSNGHVHVQTSCSMLTLLFVVIGIQTNVIDKNCCFVLKLSFLEIYTIEVVVSGCKPT